MIFFGGGGVVIKRLFWNTGGMGESKGGKKKESLYFKTLPNIFISMNSTQKAKKYRVQKKIMYV